MKYKELERLVKSPLPRGRNRNTKQNQKGSGDLIPLPSP